MTSAQCFPNLLIGSDNWILWKSSQRGRMTRGKGALFLLPSPPQLSLGKKGGKKEGWPGGSRVQPASYPGHPGCNHVLNALLLPEQLAGWSAKQSSTGKYWTLSRFVI